MILYLVICVILLLYRLSIKYHTYHLLPSHGFVQRNRVVQIVLICTDGNSRPMLNTGETKSKEERFVSEL